MPRILANQGGKPPLCVATGGTLGCGKGGETFGGVGGVFFSAGGCFCSSVTVVE
jgi:hypothetical protein